MSPHWGLLNTIFFKIIFTLNFKKNDLILTTLEIRAFGFNNTSMGDLTRVGIIVWPLNSEKSLSLNKYLFLFYFFKIANILIAIFMCKKNIYKLYARMV